MITFATLLNQIEYDTTHEIEKSFLPLAQRINDLFGKIKLCQNFDESEYYIALLERIQTLLTHLYYTKKINIPDYLWQFMSDFERIDDEFTQRYMYENLKKGSYKFINVSENSQPGPM